MGRKKQRPPYEGAACKDGWNAAGRGAKPHERPNYLSDKEREAFDDGWLERADAIAQENGRLIGYADEKAARASIPVRSSHPLLDGLAQHGIENAEADT